VAIHEALAGVCTAGDAPLTTGVGVAEFPSDAADAETLLQVADERLLADKTVQRMGAARLR